MPLIDEVREFLSAPAVSNFLTLVSVLLGIVALRYTFNPRPRIACQADTLRILGRDSALPPDIEFLFKGVRVQNVSMSRVALWNVGNTTIRGDQVVKSDPLRLMTEEGSEILEAVVICRTRVVNDVTCSLLEEKKNQVECRFDYLDPRDGALFQLIHTGASVHSAGTLRGIPEGILNIKISRPRPTKAVRQFTVVGTKRVAYGFLALGAILIIWQRLNPSYSGSQGSFALTVLGTTLILVAFLFLWATRRMPPRELDTQIVGN